MSVAFPFVVALCISVLGVYTGSVRNDSTLVDDGDDMWDQDVDIESLFQREDFDSVRRGRQFQPWNPWMQQNQSQQSIDQQNRQNGYMNVEAGVGCGYLRMRQGQVVTVQSSNFWYGEYFNNEACVWKFFGQHCVLTAQCPCADLPQSSHCIGDYLKISDGYAFLQRFCGDIRPEGEYTSVTNNLRIKFRSDHKETGAGFLCFVSCAPPGRPAFILPNNITCPTTHFRRTTPWPFSGNSTNPDSVGEVPVLPPQGPEGK